MTTLTVDIEDIGEALREGRAPRNARAYRFQFAEGNLNFNSVDIADPVPLGRQILMAAGRDDRNGYSLFAILPSGEFEDVRLDEPFDLRSRGAERFVAFETDRLFKLVVNGRQIEWGKPAISGTVLYGLAEVPADMAVFQQVFGGEDRLVESEDLIDLTEPGVERFVSAPKPRKIFDIVVNTRHREIDHRTVTYEEIVELAFPGPHEPNVSFSMTYRHAASEPHAGELGAGGHVDVKKEGTVFNVTRTVLS